MKTKDELPACPVATCVQLIGSKWKLLIMRNLLSRPWRFNELHKSLEGISQKVLTDSLRSMEQDGLVLRTAHDEVPPRVEYSLTELGESLRPVLGAMQRWGEHYREEAARHQPSNRKSAEGGMAMDMLEMLKHRRSIRKYQKRAVEWDKLEKIAEAGIYAPNPGNAQDSRIIMLDDAALIDKIGVVNAACENRNWNGRSVSADQPSIIDDLSIQSGFYGCPALGVVCISKSRKNYVNGIGAAFVTAQNMVTEAYALGVSSCIVGRAEATFEKAEMQALLRAWGLEEEYMPLVFVCLGYIDGDYPPAKPRRDGRLLYIKKAADV